MIQLSLSGGRERKKERDQLKIPHTLSIGSDSLVHTQQDAIFNNWFGLSK